MMLLSDCQIISKHNDIEVDWFNTTNETIINVLSHLENTKPSLVFIYADLILNDSLRSESKGIDLIKHIRLTPLSDSIYNVPIVLIHWLSVESYIETNLENLILFSPGIKRVRLPFHEVNTEQLGPLKENITPFIFYSNLDERISEHQFRNEIAINQFETEASIGTHQLKDKPIWFKKIYYQQGYFNNAVDNFRKQLTQNLKVLLIDDLGEKWQSAILKVLPNATIVVCKTVEETKIRINLLKETIANRRTEFVKNVNELASIASELAEKRMELNTTESTLDAANAALTSSKNALANEQRIISDKTQQLHELISELTQSNGLLETLLDFKTENINVESKQKASKLSGLISDISNSKDKIGNFQKIVFESDGKKDTNSKRKINIESEHSVVIEKHKALAKGAGNIFESLTNAEFDLILLDMHLTKESEGKEPIEMDGYKILTALTEAKLKIPTAIFSATKRNINSFKSGFKFVQEIQFLKGITPVSEFIRLIEKLESHSEASRLNETIDEVIAFSDFKYREYQAYDSQEFNTRLVLPQNRLDIIRSLNTVKSDIDNYANNKDVVHLQSAILTLGRILRDYRVVVPSNIYDRKNSMFHKSNTDKNGISSNYCDLIYWRNKTEHQKTLSSFEKTEYANWEKKLNLKVIEKYFKTVYRGLIFDE